MFVVAGLFMAGCAEQEQSRPPVPETYKDAAAVYAVPMDSMTPPEVVEVDLQRLKKVTAGRPTVVPTGLNVHLALAGKSVTLDLSLLTTITLGTDTFAQPEVVAAIDSVVVAGSPITIVAKDAYVKDRNPQNFSTFSKLQGLTHGNIPAMLEDSDGNVWLGTYGGGVSRYDGKNFTHYTEAQGLSNNVVLSMAQDTKGDIWIGTNGGGLTCYDGLQFAHYGAASGLGNTVVHCMMEDSRGRMWFGTGGGGAVSYDGKNFTRYTAQTGLGHGVVLCMMEDRNGRIWFGTEGGGVVCLDGDRFIRLDEKTFPALRTVRAMAQDAEGHIWFATLDSGAMRYDGRALVQFGEQEGMISNSLVAILQDRFGHLWFASNVKGVCSYDGQYFKHYTENDGLSLNGVRSLMEDRSGNLWIGTWGLGVSKYDGRMFTYLTTSEGLSHKLITNMVEDKDGAIWLATGGGGVSRYDGKALHHLTEKEGLCGNILLSQLATRDGSLWFGTYGNGACRYDGKHFTHITANDGLGGNDVRCMVEDTAGRIWFGLSGGGVSCYDGKRFTRYTIDQGLGSNDVRSVIQDSQGRIWFGTMGAGAVCLNNGRMTRYDVSEGKTANDVLSITEDREGQLWLGTNGGGAVCIDGQRSMRLTEHHGLSNNVVQNIIQDRKGNLWFGTRFGLNRLDLGEQQRIKAHWENAAMDGTALGKMAFRQYGYDEGFIAIGVNGGRSLHEARDGSIWIGANDRLSIHHPEGDLPDTLAPNIRLTGIALFNEAVDWSSLEHAKDSTLLLKNGVSVGNFRFDGLSRWYNLPNGLSLAHTNNYLTFSFIGITMNRPKRVRYQYMLEGIDANWSAITDRTEAPYGNLPHGSYTFHVKAMNSEGLWSQPLAYTFTIRPPWWMTWWAYAAYVILLVGSIGYYIRWREKALKARQRELEQTVEERTHEVMEEKQLVEAKNREILDSIAYAKRIQSTILPPERAFRTLLQDSFVLYLPKDIVAGDFYWLETVDGDGRIFLAACDCTGHGVPGALVSVVCHNALNKSLREFGSRTPARILDKAGELVIADFNKNMDANDEVKDGMDASVCAFDPATGKMTWAGANSPLVLIRDGQEVVEVKADKQPVGHSDKRKPYTDHEFQLKKGEVFYLITDGFADQFGGDSNRKFQKAKLRELLFSIHDMPMEQQRSTLLATFERWRGANEQVDDVTIIGVRV
jgi:ligand-binding sensor domain-containing protein/serine phosphatase RsbU (regulator of sigma subunit)